MKRLVIFAFAIIAAAYAVAVNWASTTDARIDISAKAPVPLPFLFRAGMFAYAPVPPPEPLRLLTQELKTGTVEFDLGRLAFRDAVDAADVLYRARILVPRLQAVNAAGGEVVLAFTQIPLWLSSRPTSVALLPGDILRVGNVSPPRDGSEWAALVQQVVQQMRGDLQFSPRYKVGWEPDGQSWQGTEAEFFSFYRDTAIGIRKGDPGAKVGGPSVSALYNGRGTEDPMLRRFILYCAATPVADLGWARLPLDFLVWHQFESNFLTSWANAARQAKQWLADGGYSTATELLIGEWSSWRGFPNASSPEHDQPYLASYVVSSLDAMARAGIQRAAFTSLVEQRESTTQFIGSFGLITNQYVRKPVYWAFKSLATVGPQRIGVTTNNPFVVAIAGMSTVDDETAVVAYHPPPMTAFARSVLEGLLAKGYTPTQLQQALGDMTTVERLLRGDITVASLSLPSAFAADLSAQISALSPTAIAASQALGSRVNVTVRFADVDGRRFQQTMYRIDSANANPLRIASKIDQTVQGRLASAKTTMDANLTSRLLSLGYSDAAISTLKWVLSQPDKDAAIATLSQSDRMTVLAMMQEVLKYMSELFTSITADINTWPEVAMNPATDGIASNLNGQAAVSFSMEPYSVVAVRVRRN